MALQLAIIEKDQSTGVELEQFSYKKIAFPLVENCSTAEKPVFQSYRTGPEAGYKTLVRQAVSHDCMSLTSKGRQGLYDDNSTFIIGNPIVWFAPHPDTQSDDRKGKELPFQITTVEPWQ